MHSYYQHSTDHVHCFHFEFAFLYIVASSYFLSCFWLARPDYLPTSCTFNCTFSTAICTNSVMHYITTNCVTAVWCDIVWCDVRLKYTDRFDIMCHFGYAQAQIRNQRAQNNCKKIFYFKMQHLFLVHKIVFGK